MGMDRLGIEPGPSRMLSGCDATTPTAPELMRPRVLKHLLATAFSAEALSRPARSACFRTPFVDARCGGQTSAAWNSAHRAQFSALKLCRGPPVRPFFFLSPFLLPAHSFGFFPFPFCCRRTLLVGARCGQTSAAWKSAGSEAFVAGCSLCTDSFAACWTQMRR